MPKRIDETGNVYGRLTVIGYHETRNGKAYWLCCCECGNVTSVVADKLRGGHTKSCGCLQNEIFGKKHGLRDHPLYRVWHHMIQRCENPNNAVFHHYGGRGISVCEEWRDFAAFYRDAIELGWQPSLKMDRIDNDGDYEYANVRFVNQSVQMRNTRVNHIVEIDGKSMPLIEAFERYGNETLDYQRVHKRITRGGWDVWRALTTPIRQDGLNPSAKVTPSIVIEIRELYATGDYSYNALGRMYGLVGLSIKNIVTRKAWSHIK